MPNPLHRNSRYLRFTIAVLLCGFGATSSVLAEPDPATSQGEALALEQLLTAQAAQLVFGEPPSISQSTFDMSVQYTHIAKGFWVEERCKFLSKLDGGADVTSSFNAKVAVTTGMMRQFLASEDGYAELSANKDTQKLQMYALNEMSVKSFYYCDQNAWRILAYASKEAEIWVQTIDAVKN